MRILIDTEHAQNGVRITVAVDGEKRAWVVQNQGAVRRTAEAWRDVFSEIYDAYAPSVNTGRYSLGRLCLYVAPGDKAIGDRDPAALGELVTGWMRTRGLVFSDNDQLVDDMNGEPPTASDISALDAMVRAEGDNNE